MGEARISLLGETAVILDFDEESGNNSPGSNGQEMLRRILAVARELEIAPFPGFEECIPGFTTLAVRFDPRLVDGERASEWIRRRLSSAAETPLDSRRLEIPVCYGGDLGPDLPFVGECHGLSPAEVVEIHSGAEYVVRLIGFTPGFPYLDGMSSRIAAPRLETPRLTVPAGAVGIAGQQTGIYPRPSPGGWRIIGRSPMRLFDATRDPPSRLLPGDTIRFRPISESEFHLLLESDSWESR